MGHAVAIERVDHIGIRVRDLDRALAFYGVLGFVLVRRADGDDVAIVRNENEIELNLVFNANAGDPAANILMDSPGQIPWLYSHRAACHIHSCDHRRAEGKWNSRSPRDRSASAKAGTSRCSCAIPIATLSSCAAANGRSRGRYPLRTVILSTLVDISTAGMPGAAKCTDPAPPISQRRRKAKPRHRTANCRSASL